MLAAAAAAAAAAASAVPGTGLLFDAGHLGGLVGSGRCRCGTLLVRVHLAGRECGLLQVPHLLVAVGGEHGLLARLATTSARRDMRRSWRGSGSEVDGRCDVHGRAGCGR